MNAQPLLSDHPTTKLIIRPGDRMIARVGFDLNRDQKLKVYRGISKFARTDIRLLIVNCMRTSIWWKKDGLITTLASPKHIQSDMAVGAVNLDCSVIDLRPGDVLYVNHIEMDCELRKKEIKKEIQSWSGLDVEVVLGKPDHEFAN